MPKNATKTRTKANSTGDIFLNMVETDLGHNFWVAEYHSRVIFHYYWNLQEHGSGAFALLRLAALTMYGNKKASLINLSGSE